MKNGLVSCIIPTYKRADMLPRAIDSVLNQTYSAVEVLVVDDNIPGSQESLEVKRILDLYSEHENVKYIGQKVHINGAVARNVGIDSSDAEFIAFLDDDEEWVSEKIEIQIEYLLNHPDIAGVSCLYSDYRNGTEVCRIRPYNSKDLQLKVLTGRVMIHTSTFLCRREVLIKSGAFDPNLIRHQDIQLFTDFLNFGTIVPINKYLVINHIDSEINRPDVNKLIKVKKDFFDSVASTIKKYDARTQRRIRCSHSFEVAYIALKQKEWGIFLRYMLKAVISFDGYKDLIERSRFKIPSK